MIQMTLAIDFGVNNFILGNFKIWLSNPAIWYFWAVIMNPMPIISNQWASTKYEIDAAKYQNICFFEMLILEQLSSITCHF